MTDPAGTTTKYYWDGATDVASGSDPIKPFNLTAVAFPDGRTRQFHYAESDRIVIPSGSTALWTLDLLTGITDEHGRRFSYYTYNYDARVLSSEFVGGVFRHAFASIPGREGTAVTDPLLTVRNYFTYQNRVSQVTQPAGAGSGPCAQDIFYDYQTGLPTEQRNFNGNLTCTRYDLVRRIPTSRLEGRTGAIAIGFCSASAFTSPPAGARVISTQWHPDWRLETRIAEPKKLTTITYNGQGATCAPSTVLVDGKPPAVVCTRTEQATTDETGAAGFAATVTGTARTWRYTYTTYGRVLTATDPNNRTTTTSYHPDNDADLGKRGNVASITNAANHTTYITDYNPHGQPTRIVDPNGVVTVLTYDPRMRLTSRAVGNEATVFGYDPVGQMTSVTLPDGARLTYTYDAAHRLTAINDHKGNRIDYTLDAMGNRITEKTKDPGGVAGGQHRARDRCTESSAASDRGRAMKMSGSTHLTAIHLRLRGLQMLWLLRAHCGQPLFAQSLCRALCVVGMCASPSAPAPAQSQTKFVVLIGSNISGGIHSACNQQILAYVAAHPNRSGPNTLTFPTYEAALHAAKATPCGGFEKLRVVGQKRLRATFDHAKSTRIGGFHLCRPLVGTGALHRRSVNGSHVFLLAE